MDFRCKKNGVKWSKIDRIGLTRDYLGSKKLIFLSLFWSFDFFLENPLGLYLGGLLFENP